VLDHVVPQRQESDQPALAPQRSYVAFADRCPAKYRRSSASLCSLGSHGIAARRASNMEATASDLRE